MNSTRSPMVVEFVDEGLGHSSYLVDLGDGTALVVDPARLPIAQRDEAQRRGLRIAFTADTHTHADYISGGAELAGEGAAFLAPAEAGLEVPHLGVAGDDEIDVGCYRLKAIATPGHTPDHLAYLLLDAQGPVALFSGGSLMVGTVGRTDLLGAERAEELARRQHDSIQKLLTLPDDLTVYPTHGAGSFCAAPAGSARTTTIGRERATNPLLSLDEDAFVEQIRSTFGSLPAHFRRLPEVNRRGPQIYAEVPALSPIAPGEARVLLDRGATLLDVRPIERYSTAHPAGAMSIGLRPAFASWAGWLVNPDHPVVFVIDDDQDESDLVRQCLSVGLEQLAGRLDGGADAWRVAHRPAETTPLVEPEGMAEAVIDVRQRDEYRTEHVPGALNVELGELATIEIPDGPVTIMCGHGERAMTGASILTARGHDHVTVLAGGPDTWAGLTGRALTPGP